MVMSIIKKEKVSVGILLILTVAFLSGCSESNDQAWGSAPDFTLSKIDGGTFTLSDNSGKIILIDLMAAWCYWCLPQMEELRAVSEEKGNEIIIISVGVDKSETFEDLQQKFGDYTDKWIFLLDNYDEDVASKYEVNGIPRLVFIDKKGDIAFSHEGLMDKNDIISEIDKIK